MERSARSLLAASLCALALSCAGINYRSLPQVPIFELPALEDPGASDVEIETIQQRIEEEEAVQPKDEDEVKAKEETLKDLHGLLATEQAKRSAILERNHQIQQRRELIEEHNIEAAARNAELNRASGLGIRFYQPSPYLLVYADGRGGLVWQIHHLPDPTKKMSAKPYNYLSTLEAKLTFDEHYLLSSTHEVADTTAIPSAVLSKIAELAPLIAAALNVPREETERTLPAPHLYKIVEEHGRIQLVGGACEPSEWKVTLPPPANDAASKKGGDS